MAIDYGRLMHSVSNNKQILIWYYYLEYAINAKVVKESNLVNIININNVKYNPEEVFMDSNLSKNNEESKTNFTLIANYATFLSLINPICNFNQL